MNRPIYSPGGITSRSLFLGLLCVILISVATPYNNLFLGGTSLAGNHFPIAGVFLFTIIILFVNAAIRKISPTQAFSPAELIVAWGMTIVSAGIPYSGLMRYLIPLLVAPIFFASPENEWRQFYHPHLSDWIVIKNKQAVDGFYQGGLTVPWQAWVKPLSMWAIFVLLIYLVMFCLCAILRKQWVERERYIFPLVRLPIELANQPQPGLSFNSFFRNRLVWIGFSVPLVLHLVNGLNAYWPELPQIPTEFQLSRYFTEKPWTALRRSPAVNFKIFPSVVGITYLLTLDVAFSFWFFFLFNKLEQVFLLAIGSKWSGSTFASGKEWALI